MWHEIPAFAGMTSAVTGKGYVDGVHDHNKLKPSISPAASATGLFIFLDLPNPQTRRFSRYSAKILERR
jgi:hypothetical protein